MVPPIPYLIVPWSGIFTSNMVQQEKRYCASVSQSSSVVYFNQKLKLQNFINLQLFMPLCTVLYLKTCFYQWKCVCYGINPSTSVWVQASKTCFSIIFPSFGSFLNLFYLIYFFHVKKALNGVVHLNRQLGASTSWRVLVIHTYLIR